MLFESQCTVWCSVVHAALQVFHVSDCMTAAFSSPASWRVCDMFERTALGGHESRSWNDAPGVALATKFVRSWIVAVVLNSCVKRLPLCSRICSVVFGAASSTLGFVAS